MHGSTQDEVLTPVWTPQRILRYMCALGMNPGVPASNPDEDLGPGSD